MIVVRFIEFLKAHIKAVVRLSWAGIVLVVLCDWLLVDKEHAHTKPEHWFGFWSLFGFISCLAINLFAKLIGHMGLMRKEDYYGDQ